MARPSDSELIAYNATLRRLRAAKYRKEKRIRELSMELRCIDGDIADTQEKLNPKNWREPKTPHN